MEKLVKINKKNLNILYIVTLIVFIAIGVFEGVNHEAWADEAQAWLIARDTSFTNMFKAASYEGTQPLWYIVIKLFQLVKLPYSCFFVVSLTVSVIGVVILFFFTDISVVSKILIAFSFTAMYQNVAVARNYSLVFPFMMLIAAAYDKRKEKPLLYYLGVFLLSLTSSYGTLIAGSFFLADAPEILGMFKDKEKRQKKFVLGYFLSGALIGVLTLLVLPPDDVSFSPGNSGKTIFRHITTIFLLNIDNEIISALVFALLASFFIVYLKSSKSTLKALIMVLPILMYIRVFAGNNWHYTNIYFLIIAVLIMFKPDFNEMNKGIANFLKAFAVIVLCSQVALTVYAVQFDYKEDYSGSEKAAEFISEYVENGDAILSADYYGTALQPYFDKNIYVNHPGDAGYYWWSSNNNYNISYNLTKIEKTVGKKPDVIVTGPNFKDDFAGHEKHVFSGNMCYKNIISHDSEITVWVKN